MRRPTPTHRPRRTGLTLVELLVVILVIGLLMALLLPAVRGAYNNAKQAQVTTEISNLATALADFKNKFGEFPPSRLYCNENGNYSTSGFDADTARLIQRSQQYIKKFWPRVTLSTTGNVDFSKIPNAGICYDFNGNRSADGTAYILEGPECLVFFLGGIPDLVNNQFAMTGFGRNPINPFQAIDHVVDPTTKKVNILSSNRILPLYEFISSRLDDSGEITPDGQTKKLPNRVPCYLDPLSSPADQDPISESNNKRPYAYFYSYGADSYDPNDYNSLSEVDSTGAVIGRGFTVAFSSDVVPSAGPNPYTTSGPVVFADSASTITTGAKFQNSNTFQILSSGLDRQWGIGGQFLPQGTEHAPFNPGSSSYDSGTYVSVGDTGNPRIRESDNLTNFSGGRIN